MMWGWLTKWRESVDFGLRPRHVHEGAEINLYPFTKRAAQWVAMILTYGIITIALPERVCV
jgi:hypothetical protein